MKTIDKNIIAMGWVSLFTDLASSMVTTLLPLFVVYVLHEGVDKLGIVIAVATFVSYGFRVLFGYLSDRLSIVKPFVVIGYLISAVTKPLLFFSYGYGSVAMLRGAERIGKAVRSAPKDALISAYAKERRIGRTFGFHKMMGVTGELSGALIIVVIFMLLPKDESTIRTIFAWTLLPGIIATSIVIFFVKDAPDRPRKQIVFQREDRKLYPLLGIYFISLFFLLSDQYMILKARDVGFTLAQIPLLVVAFTLTQVATSYSSGMFIDRFGSRSLLLIAFILAIVSTLALYAELIWFSFVCLGLFTVFSLNALRSYIGDNAKSQGAVYGIFYGGIAIFASLGALAVGHIWEYYGFEYAVLFSLAGLLMTTTMLLVYFYMQRSKDATADSRR